MATIPLPGWARWAVYDPATDQVCANIRHPAQILAISAASVAIDRFLDIPAPGPHTTGVTNNSDGPPTVFYQRR
jgi:hypothetical protein